MKTLARISALAAVCSALGLTGCIGNNEKDNDMDTLNLTAEWDKVFPQNEKTEHTKVTFRNRYGITLAADMYMPRGASGKLPAIAVCGPFGSEDTYKRLKSENKELMIIPGANHTDLYDTDRIPFDHIENFYRKYLK